MCLCVPVCLSVREAMPLRLKSACGTRVRMLARTHRSLTVADHAPPLNNLSSPHCQPPSPPPPCFPTTSPVGTRTCHCMTASFISSASSSHLAAHTSVQRLVQRLCVWVCVSACAVCVCVCVCLCVCVCVSVCLCVDDSFWGSCSLSSGLLLSRPSLLALTPRAVCSDWCTWTLRREMHSSQRETSSKWQTLVS